MSLVANYTDSEDEEEPAEDKVKDEEIDNNNKNQDEDISISIQTELPSSSSKTTVKLKNPFGVDNNEDSSDLSSGEDKDDSSVKTKPKSDGIPLDNPFRYFGAGNVASEDSVFRVEFREQDAKKTAVLERHVKMSQVTPAATMINGKKICWNNRKGRCRFGHNCKFAHDTDTAVIDPESVVVKLPDKNFQPVQPEQNQQQNQQKVPTDFKKRNPFSMDNLDWDSESRTSTVLSSLAHLSGSGSGNSIGKNRKNDSDGDDHYEDIVSNKPKKKRPGLASNLNPSTKVMKMYYKNKEKDNS